ncbi:glycosyltransferase family 90 protein [Gonapodya prolifera JEL478]|uniref:Glycosyltransferase family 90 protein n=1 Tax=Gonapodya prolifera (strain JEL478) TaxID=1344416 RepID=A0A139A9Y3_GONPJ|nr:glycosyltransferase family 90 protein [Gonapodya prolifera JEL478]|eukprot:KXS13611.1 glycosyltransferase family 90 protein [Gonapodya prolifera JEL478]
MPFRPLPFSRRIFILIGTLTIVVGAVLLTRRPPREDGNPTIWTFTRRADEAWESKDGIPREFRDFFDISKKYELKEEKSTNRPTKSTVRRSKTVPQRSSTIAGIPTARQITSSSMTATTSRLHMTSTKVSATTAATTPSPDHFVLDIKHVPYVHKAVRFPARSTDVPTYEEARAYYQHTQGRPPPRLYKPFYHFAVENKCNVLGHAHFNQYFKNLPKNITLEMLEKASNLERIITVVIGPLKGDESTADDCWCDKAGNPLEHPEYIVQDAVKMGEEHIRWANLMKPFAKWFPKNFRVPVNELDWPRIKIPGVQCVYGDNIPSHVLNYTGPETPQLLPTNPDPSNTSFNFTRLREMDLHNPFDMTVPPSMTKYHNFFFWPSEERYGKEVLPIFSPGIVPGCHADIPFPTWYAAESAVDKVGPDLTVKGADLPWLIKTPVALWRGSSTGGISRDDPSTWNRHHRLRLAKISHDLHRQECGEGGPPWNKTCQPKVDAHLYAYMFASGELQKYFGKPEDGVFVPLWQQLGYRYLIDVDGNSFSARLYTFFREAKSLILRVRAFVDWLDVWAVPYVHYIPVKTDWSDLLGAIQWAEENPDEAQKIVERARDLGRNGLRWTDAHCEMFALMMELDDRIVGRGRMPPVRVNVTGTVY